LAGENRTPIWGKGEVRDAPGGGVKKVPGFGTGSDGAEQSEEVIQKREKTEERKNTHSNGKCAYN